MLIYVSDYANIRPVLGSTSSDTTAPSHVQTLKDKEGYIILHMWPYHLLCIVHLEPNLSILQQGLPWLIIHCTWIILDSHMLWLHLWHIKFMWLRCKVHRSVPPLIYYFMTEAKKNMCSESFMLIAFASAGLSCYALKPTNDQPSVKGIIGIGKSEAGPVSTNCHICICDVFRCNFRQKLDWDYGWKVWWINSLLMYLQFSFRYFCAVVWDWCCHLVEN